MAKDAEGEFKTPATVDDINFYSPNCAGGAGIFGRYGGRLKQFSYSTTRALG